MAGQHDVRRTLTVSVCFGQRLNALGEFEDFDETIFRATTPERATRYLRRKYGDDTITVNRVESDTSVYELSFEDFLKYAHIVEDENDPILNPAK